MTRQAWALAAGAAVLASLVTALVLVAVLRPAGHRAAGGDRSERSDRGASTAPITPMPLQSGASEQAQGAPTPGGAGQSSGSALAAGVVDPGPVTCPAATVKVGSAAQLSAALAAAKPGDSIALADGTYAGQFTASTPGTAQAPVYLCGGRGAVIDGGKPTNGYAFHLDHASFWRLVGFTITGGQKGIVADAVDHAVIQDVAVHDVGDEGIHLRSASSDNVVRGCQVYNTGLHSQKFGEGIYIGSARKNWPKYGAAGGPDRSDHNLIVGNTVHDTAAENVDIKEGTTGGVLAQNTFDGHGMSGADSWVDVKGNDWLIESNHGTNAPTDGFQSHRILDGWGTGNVFRANTAVVNAAGYAIHLTPPQDNRVTCDNTAQGAAQGLSNIPCT